MITLFHECVTGSDEILSQPPILVNAHAGARKIIRSVGENQVLTRDGIDSFRPYRRSDHRSASAVVIINRIAIDGSESTIEEITSGNCAWPVNRSAA